MRRRLAGLHRDLTTTADTRDELAYRATLGLQLAAHAGLVDLHSPLVADTLVLICRTARFHDDVHRTFVVRPGGEPPSVAAYPILNATIELIEQRGLEEVTFAHIAARTGISRGALRSIFGTPERLLADQRAFIIDEILGEYTPPPQGGSDVANELWSLTQHSHVASLLLTLTGLPPGHVRARVDPHLYASLRRDEQPAGATPLLVLAALDSYYILSPSLPGGRPRVPQDVAEMLEELIVQTEADA